MAKPVPSIVIKTKKPTQQQVARRAALTPGLGAPAAPGGTYASGHVATDPQIGLAPLPPAPIHADQHGVVLSPVALHGALAKKPGALPNAPAKKPAKVKITVHPDGRVEVHSQPHPTAAPAPTYTPQGGPSAIPPDARPTGEQSLRDLPPTDVVTQKPKPRVVATTKPAAAAAAPPTDFQSAQTQAEALLDPLVKQITDAINARTGQQQQAITGYSGELGRLFGLYNTQADPSFNTNIASEATVNDSLANRLAGVTSDTGGDLAAKLAAIGADPATAARVTGDVQAAGTGAGNTGFALGSADLSKLIGDKSNSDTYGAKLPGLAGLYGLQSTKQAQAQGTTDLSTALTTLEQSAPGLTSSLLSQIQSNKNQQQQLAFEKQQFGDKTKAATTAATTKTNTVDTTLSKSLGFLVNAQGNPVLKGGKIVEMPQSSTTRKANASLSKSLGYVVDSTGAPILRDGKKITLPKSATVKPPSAATTAKALGLARNAHQGVTDSKGVQHPPLSWQQYLSNGLSEGIPAETLIEQGRKVYSQPEIHQGLIPGQGGSGKA